MSTPAPDPTYVDPRAGWTAQNRHQTSTETGEEIMIGIPLPEVTEEKPAPSRKARSRAKVQE